MLLTDVPGVLDAQGRLVATLDRATVEAMIAGGVIAGGMMPKVRAALASATALGGPAVIASWKDPAAVASLASAGRVGVACTVVLPDAGVRPAAHGRAGGNEPAGKEARAWT